MASVFGAGFFLPFLSKREIRKEITPAFGAFWYNPAAAAAVMTVAGKTPQVLHLGFPRRGKEEGNVIITSSRFLPWLGAKVK